MRSATRVELPEHMSGVWQSALVIFDWASQLVWMERKVERREAGQPLPSVECNVGTPATAEIS